MRAPLHCWLASALIVFGWAVTAAGAPPTGPVLVLQAPPAAAVNSVTVSPDGSLVAAAADEGGVRLHDARSGALLRTIGAGDRGVLFSPDGRTLTAAGFHMDKLIGLYEVQTGKRFMNLAGLTEWEVYAMAISPDGKLLASTGTDKQILIWELSSGKLRHQLKDQPEKIAALAFSPDSRQLVTGSGDGTVRQWDVESGTPTGVITSRTAEREGIGGEVICFVW